MSHDHLGLFDTPPDRRQVRLSLAIVGLLFAAFLATFPVRDTRLADITGFIATVDAVMFVGLLITAALLFSQASLFRSRALLVLAAGYVFIAVLLIPHLLAFPGTFAPDGLIGGDPSTAAWVTFGRRAGFAAAAILYVLLKRADAATQPAGRPEPRTALAVAVALVLALAVTLASTLGAAWLPPVFSNSADVIPSGIFVFESVVTFLIVVATVILYRSRSSVLDMWLLVAFAGWLVQSLLILTISERFTIGWYCLYAVTLFSQLVVMFALIAESNRLYARLALSTSERRRERDARLMSMDAVAAAFSHEIGQPLTGIRLNAKGSLNWLTRPQPDVDMAIKSLHATIDSGRRASDVMKSIRAIFAKGPGRASEFSLNELARDTATLMDRELTVAGVSIRFALDPALPPVRGNRTQMQQVLVNLFTNAIESMNATGGRLRRISVRSTLMDGGDVLLEVRDSGAGIPPEELERILDAFYSTKPQGVGLGLSLCRTIVEEHGGRLWASQDEGPGATLNLQLPRSRVSAQ